MQQTLFFIPHWLLDGPLLIGWLCVGALILVWQYLKHGFSNETFSFLPIFLIVAAAIYFVIPRVEVLGINPDDPMGPLVVQGLAVRGYGLMLLTAIVAGVGLTMSRCEKIGVSRDQITQLAFWMMLCGIAGARLFYVIQKSDQIFPDGLSFQSLTRIVDMTKGGLVVYGSLIGGTLAALIFLKLNQLPVWRTADLIAPGMVLGLAIGRIGCLMNGCCYGGVCSNEYPAVTFPAGSPPYMRQLETGDLLGISGKLERDKATPFPVTVEQVSEDSFASQHGIVVGDQLRVGHGDSDLLRFVKGTSGKSSVDADLPVAVIKVNDGREIIVPVSALPDRSARTHPTQIYSTVNAFLLCMVLWYFWTLNRRDGQVFALMLILYPVGRFLMEIVRQDEAGQFGTGLTISQLVSLGMVLIGFAMFAMAKSKFQQVAQRPGGPILAPEG
ncbi:prolipoprotein diacylglyceryl transferase [Mariniblastus sp.]|nr:prolipoprotein diacylglyceryl transferase [Mariniblastus sp.]